MAGYNQKLQKPPHVIFRVVEGAVVILNTKSNLYYVLDNIGAVVWQLLLAGKSKDEVSESIRKRYEVALKDTVKKDIEELIDDMLKEGLLETRKSQRR